MQEHSHTMKLKTFIKRSVIQAPVDEVFKWHARPGALERLSPPWDPIEVITKSAGIGRGAMAVLALKAGPLPVKLKWVAEHTAYEENRLFQDRQIKGPFASWIHTHRFSSSEAGTSCLEDQIDYALPLEPWSAFLGHAYFQKKLGRIFAYRHATLKRDMADHSAARKRSERWPLTVMISGASGVVGTALTPFLTTGGHRMIPLVRRPPTVDGNEVFWNPESRRLDPADLRNVDVVIHLAGENIGRGSWTKQKKQKIIQSRRQGTGLLAKTMAGLDTPPRLLICASAVGYYGNRGEDTMTEVHACGTDFISEVCREWENAASPAVERGIRVVFLRIGVALSPLGGALKKMLPAFRYGLGGRFGSGRQFVSWIDMNDLIGAIYHIISTPSLSGPVNVVAPHPVTNREFTLTLGKVLSRPTPFTVPEWAIKGIFGEMDREILLSSTRAKPQKLEQSGYQFRFSRLEGSLRHLLGR